MSAGKLQAKNQARGISKPNKGHLNKGHSNKAHPNKAQRRPLHQSSSTSAAEPTPASGVVNVLSRTSSTTRAHLTSTAFATLRLREPTQRAVAEVLGYTTMTLVQEQTLAVALTGQDVIAKAKTGTGKTIAFLLPTIERLAAASAAGTLRGIGALAISPTRELASQIRSECDQLMTFHKGVLDPLIRIE